MTPRLPRPRDGGGRGAATPTSEVGGPRGERAARSFRARAEDSGTAAAPPGPRAAPGAAAPGASALGAPRGRSAGRHPPGAETQPAPRTRPAEADPVGGRDGRRTEPEPRSAPPRPRERGPGSPRPGCRVPASCLTEAWPRAGPTSPASPKAPGRERPAPCRPRAPSAGRPASVCSAGRGALPSRGWAAGQNCSREEAGDQERGRQARRQADGQPARDAGRTRGDQGHRGQRGRHTPGTAGRAAPVRVRVPCLLRLAG